MKKVILLLFLSVFCFACKQHSKVENRNCAILLNRYGDCISIGMGIIDYPWTIEAWIKGNDTSWYEEEVLIGGGTYHDISYVDDAPLALRNGRLNSTRADLWASEVLNDQWHHVAVSCDCVHTSLFLDGEKIDEKEAAYPVLVDALGMRDESNTAFCGEMDEVRIWTDALSEKTIKQWYDKLLQSKHPHFKSLKGYYTFDDELGETSANLVGKGVLSYHVRNYLKDQGKLLSPDGDYLYRATFNDNPDFNAKLQKYHLFNAVVVDSEWDSDQGAKGEQILKLRIVVHGNIGKPLRLTELALDLSATTSLADLEKIQVWYTGDKARSLPRVKLFDAAVTNHNILLGATGDGSIELKPGVNYLLVMADIAEDAQPGNTIKIKVPAFSLNGKVIVPEESPNPIVKQVARSSRKDPNMLRVMQWNVWHGGVHLGTEGVERTMEIIRKMNPDVITMQEGYGSQYKIAEVLGYYLQTPSPNDNLVVFSRYPIEKLPSSKTFNSNPGIITMPNGRRILVNSVWLRYATNPEYTGNFPNSGHDTNQWIADDSIKGLADISHILTHDVKPVMEDADMAVIIGGDFNSCSHLDWTAAAAPLHYGYGPVDFPISRYMLDEGYKDSFREAHPDEVERPEGTYGSIFGQLQHSRIDFLYHRGKGVKVVSSKIFRTHPEIDFVWTSDHDAVLTDYEIRPVKDNAD